VVVMMAFPVVLAVDEDQDTLGILEIQLTQRYSHDYRVECLVDPGRALLRLTELAERGEEMALVLAANTASVTANDGLLVHVRELHPHAKCALLVTSDVWADKSSANEIRALIALGRVHYYAVRPAGPPDEVFHEAISSFLLEWATERRTVPHNIHIVGQSWSGRAYELRQTFERCAASHTFCLADSDEGRELLAKAGPEAKLPIMVLPDGRVLSDPPMRKSLRRQGPRATSTRTSMTSSSWVPVRRDCPQPSTVPPKACASSCSMRVELVDKSDRAH
jgi:thioredoxin reductase (NADPH)